LYTVDDEIQNGISAMDDGLKNRIRSLAFTPKESTQTRPPGTALVAQVIQSGNEAVLLGFSSLLLLLPMKRAQIFFFAHKNARIQDGSAEVACLLGSIVNKRASDRLGGKGGETLIAIPSKLPIDSGNKRSHSPHIDLLETTTCA
jgi:hypothetical protein